MIPFCKLDFRAKILGEGFGAFMAYIRSWWPISVNGYQNVSILQRYRHVDYISFENPWMCDRFLNYWRSTGNQRLGIMYGRYEPHKDIPLGIKATVAAIYEPPQVK